MATFFYDHDDLQKGLERSEAWGRTQPVTTDRRSFLRTESSDSTLPGPDETEGKALGYRSASSLQTLSSLGHLTGLLLPTPPIRSLESLRGQGPVRLHDATSVQLHGMPRGPEVTPRMGGQALPTPEYTPPKLVPRRKRSVHDLAGLCLRVSELPSDDIALMSNDSSSRRRSSDPERSDAVAKQRQSAATEFEEDYSDHLDENTWDSTISSEEDDETYPGPLTPSQLSLDRLSLRSFSSASSHPRRRKVNHLPAELCRSRSGGSGDIGAIRRRPISSLKQRLALRDKSLDRSPELTKFARQIEWPLTPSTEDQPLAYATNTNRLSTFSAMSANSRTVEAVILDSPPQKQHNLRRTGRLGARDILPSKSSFRARLFPRISQGDTKGQNSPERGRREFGDGLRAEMRQVLARLPIVVFGDRLASMRADTEVAGPVIGRYEPEDVRNGLRTNTFGLSDRTPPRPSRTERSRDRDRPDMLRTGRSRKKAAYPVIPKRGPSLSASTSRSASQTSTATGRRPLPSRPGSEGHAAHGSRRASVELGAWGRKRKESATLSLPRSRRSLDSGFSPYSMSPEVREARAISIVAHHCESVKMLRASAANLDGPHAPLSDDSDFVDDGDSINANRQSVGSQALPGLAPGQPDAPAFRITPPTPDISQINKPLPQLPQNHSWPQAPLADSLSSNRTLSMLKRRLSSRSGTGRPPLVVVPASRRSSIDDAVPPDIKRFGRGSSADEEVSRLHPRWKPRMSMSDLEDDDWRRASGSEERNQQRPATSSGTERYGPSAFRPARSVHRIPGTPLEIEFLGWSGLKEKIHESKGWKEERRRARNREKRRSMIGPRIVVTEEA